MANTRLKFKVKSSVRLVSSMCCQDIQYHCIIAYRKANGFVIGVKLVGSQREKICLQGFANKKGADQPAHLCSLISTFVIG